MRRCFYYTDLGKNAVFHNFAIQIELTQDSGRSKHACAFTRTVKKISKITYIDGDKGTGTLGRVCGDLGLGDARGGTWGHLVWDAGRMGRGDVWDAGTCGTGTRGLKCRGRGR